MAQPVVLAVAHGSRVPAANAEARSFSAALSARMGQDVSICFLELAEPDLATGLSQAAEQAGPSGTVVVLPLLLGAAGHYRNDLGTAVRWARRRSPEVTFNLAAPLGPHGKLGELVAFRVQEALAASGDPTPDPESVGVLLVARGSSDPGGNSEVARLAYLLFASGRYRTVEYAFQAVARPTLAEGVQRCHALGVRQLVVAPYLLFTGDVERDVCQVTEATARSLHLPLLHAGHLGVHPLLEEVAQQRIADALAGDATVTCDLCRYRTTILGHEDQVGQAQASHHLHGGTAHNHDHEHDHSHSHANG